MNKLLIILALSFLSLTGAVNAEEDVTCADVGVMSREQVEDEVARLRRIVNQFYEFREKVYYNIPIDYLSKLTLDDFISEEEK